MYHQFKTMTEISELSKVVKQVIQQDAVIKDGVLTEEDVCLLLDSTEDNLPRETMVTGYPNQPLYKEVSASLHMWMETKTCPLVELKKYDLLTEDGDTDRRMTINEEVTPLLESLHTALSDNSSDDQAIKLLQVFKTLGRRGLLDLLGVRKTTGSVDLWPPSRNTLINTFSQKNKYECIEHMEFGPSSDLSVGARALAKHCHRDESLSWWGNSTGSEEQKNSHALEVINRILDGATWINLHELPPQLPVLEVRQENGYGARWSHDGLLFRGFLEPQMQDGHSVGWRH